MTSFIMEILGTYEDNTNRDKKNIMKEMIQEIVLYSLSKAGFFKDAAFYGGTALRIIHGLDRFSEDLDFSLKTSDKNFNLANYFPIMEKEIASFGLNVEIEEKTKTSDSQILSAFLKANTQEHSLLFFDEKVSQTHPNEKLKIKFEVDTNPPKFANFEYEYRLLPVPYEVQVYDLPSLFAGKIHAVLCRDWKDRVKGRDYYDYIFFLSKNVPVNLEHLKARLIQSGFLNDNESFGLQELKDSLSQKFDNISFEKAKEDVLPFIKNSDSLRLWKPEFFKKITENLKVE